MPTSIIIDLLIVAVLALSIILGWAKGLVRSLLTLASMILAFFLASQIANFTSDLIIEQVVRPAAHSAIEQYVNELDITSFGGLIQIEPVLSIIENDLVREIVRLFLSNINLPDQEMTRDTALRIGCGIADTVLRGVVRDILSAGICILCFVVISFLLRPVIWAIEQAFQLPLLRQINRIGGLIAGTVRGILIVLIAVWALRVMGLCVTDEVIAQSFLLKYTVMLLNVFGLSGPVLP